MLELHTLDNSIPRLGLADRSMCRMDHHQRLRQRHKHQRQTQRGPRMPCRRVLPCRSEGHRLEEPCKTSLTVAKANSLPYVVRRFLIQACHMVATVESSV